VIASPGNRASEVAGMEQSCDHVARLIAAVLRLCEVERRASDAGNLYGLYLSNSRSIILTHQILSLKTVARNISYNNISTKE